MDETEQNDFDNDDNQYNEEDSLQSFQMLQHCVMTPTRKKNNMSKFLLQFQQILLNKIKQLQQIHINFKVRVVLKVEYWKPSNPNETHEPAYLSSRNIAIYNDFELESIVDKICLQLENRNINYMRVGSGLSIKEIKSITIDIAKIKPLRAGCGFASLPPSLEKKHAIINVHNKDERCFGYAILSALHEPNRNPQRPSNYNHLFARHGLEKIQYPVAPQKMPTIEDQLQISINIYSFVGEDGTDLYGFYVSKKKFSIHIDLLYWENHYAWIKNFSRFACGSTKHNGQMHYCKQCLSHFQTEDYLKRHLLHCEREEFSQESIHLPAPGTNLKFNHIRFQQKQPIVIYADCESILEASNKETKRNSNISTKFYQHHIPCSV